MSAKVPSGSANTLCHHRYTHMRRMRMQTNKMQVHSWRPNNQNMKDVDKNNKNFFFNPEPAYWSTAIQAEEPFLELWGKKRG